MTRMRAKGIKLHEQIRRAAARAAKGLGESRCEHGLALPKNMRRRGFGPKRGGTIASGVLKAMAERAAQDSDSTKKRRV